ncbi:bifunctional phosphoribosylaminoimidazolecarboxamide formyltransferase/IMP cyclohydrolase [Apibacter sp. wkB309]|uniref:bifunctional phosphoribosylaminoimidazolecarboxamide formyltransferase/IMP cyclohydrolase n=1 Tax=Apibacter sp. wkB309 TaxID=1679467 RepID=UPI000CF99A77|nr:bifunctional phosphoribosylaminoimidazolecarboxamide formyltransferase/IMP cyclohydrolase [Apibacter sp. wkB309]PQL90090.1 bifunctional phosphoribosylaminoimidazolecarboxamide formyltransferase/inosine monophosphate cyclohydrolase [Apibacter sp. wkB309]
MKRALISVSDKTNIIDFSIFLQSQGYEIISTGGTYKHLKSNGLNVTEVSEYTGFPEILDGRVKTLHPSIHGGILASRTKEEHLQSIHDLKIKTIDLVIVNLYPFFDKLNKGLSEQEMIEFIDIGGPTMLRSAAKNFHSVTVISQIEDYSLVIEELKKDGNTSLATRKKLAGKVFNLTSSYDAAISNYLLQDDYPKYLNTSFEKVENLRYGENPHQKAAFYIDKTKNGAMKDFEQLQGKELSFNNFRDMDMAYKVVNEFSEISCCAVKHSTPCGVALGNTIVEAYQKAFECDPISIFGGIIAFNRTVDEETARLLITVFLEIVIAPSFTGEALQLLSSKKSLRVIKVNNPVSDSIEFVKVDGGLLVQDVDHATATDFTQVTNSAPDKKQLEDLIFAQKIVKHAKSNAIVVASDFQALGIGSGQTNRIWAAQEAIERAKEKRTDQLVLASDAFFPFRDVVDTAAKNGITAIIQPGGSIRDKESIEACNEYNIPMIFTGIRHFKH